MTDSCPICFESLNLLDKSSFIETPCSHIFHTDCLNEWVGRNPTCPICRFSLSDSNNQEIPNIYPHNIHISRLLRYERNNNQRRPINLNSNILSIISLILLIFFIVFIIYYPKYAIRLIFIIYILNCITSIFGRKNN